jgi:undecaprenyl-diphosphatase
VIRCAGAALSFFEAIVMAILQGVTELFPVSSLGHAVIFPRLVGWGDLVHNKEFLPYLVVMHLGTAIALFLFFLKDWLAFLNGVMKADTPRAVADRRIFSFVVLATIPAVIVGFALHKPLEHAFSNPSLVAFVLILNGAMLYFSDQLAGRGVGTLDQLNWKGALAIGVAQCFALVPGFSRSGLTIAAGVVAGLKHEDAARFSFLMATPIIVGATVLEAPKLMHQGGLGFSALVSGVTAGVIAYGSLVVLMRWFHGHEFNALKPFAYYCAVAGLVSLALMIVI